MIVDTSAVMAILLLEPDAPDLLRTIVDSEMPVGMSAIELGIVCARHSSDGLADIYRRWLDESDIEIMAVDEDQVRLAWKAFEMFGKGRHSAGLDFGDCFAYALARQTGRPLLFKGRDFALTDIVPALP